MNFSRYRSASLSNTLAEMAAWSMSEQAAGLRVNAQREKVGEWIAPGTGNSYFWRTASVEGRRGDAAIVQSYVRVRGDLPRARFVCLALVFFAAARSIFSRTRNRTILLIRLKGIGSLRGNCTEPLAPL
jgi:hypothetical protein